MQASADKIWGSAQQQLRSMLSADTYNLWFAQLRVSFLDGNSLILEVANDFCEVWLKDNYLGLLQDVLALAAGRQLQIKFKVGTGSAAAHAVTAPPSPTIWSKAKTTQPLVEKNASLLDLNFNPKNTFDTFVVGSNNN